ncbi:hypothetical protein MK805_08165 [Shimazuella sp. AN120528]|uniref:hypothetical protein n=1 Tax=Shimazuella soli TaxID=1892854 RepID=UPI001F0E7473|nr:hypothetical protein [Shimazuella soli]MCH5584947.1 hypothetical protein [Shimazuella soli]
MRLRFFLQFLCISILLTSCTVSSLPSTHTFGAIYTNATIPDSAFVLFDQNGDKNHEFEIPAMGIFQIVNNGSGNIFLPVQYENKIYSLTLANNELKETKSHPYPIYMKQTGNFRVTTFNSALQAGTVEWQEGKTSRSWAVSGFPRIATFDQTYIYVFATIIEQKKPVLYVINRNSAKIAAAIPIKIDQANDMQVIDHRLFITSVANQNQIAIFDCKTKKITYQTLPELRPEYIVPMSQYLLISYQNSKKLTKIDRKTYRILEQIELPQPVFKLKQKANELYVLSQIPANGQGLVGVYNISNWKLKKKYLLPTIRDTTVQDIVVF